MRGRRMICEISDCLEKEYSHGYCEEHFRKIELNPRG